MLVIERAVSSCLQVVSESWLTVDKEEQYKVEKYNANPWTPLFQPYPDFLVNCLNPLIHSHSDTKLFQFITEIKDRTVLSQRFLNGTDLFLVKEWPITTIQREAQNTEAVKIMHPYSLQNALGIAYASLPNPNLFLRIATCKPHPTSPPT